MKKFLNNHVKTYLQNGTDRQRNAVNIPCSVSYRFLYFPGVVPLYLLKVRIK